MGYWEAKRALFQLYYGESNLHFDEMMVMMSALHYTSMIYFYIISVVSFLFETAVVVNGLACSPRVL
jgi:hypothetical protein